MTTAVESTRQVQDFQDGLIPPSLHGWYVIHGGNRKGAYITVRDSADWTRDVMGTVIGWCGDTGRPSTRKNATYCTVRRWSYSRTTRGIPSVFLVWHRSTEEQESK